MGEKLVIGMDVDGFIAHYDGWKGHYENGPPMDDSIEEIQKLIDAGHTICLCSCTPDYMIREWAKKYQIPHHYVNDSPYPRDGLKLSFDIYIGDETMTFDGRWEGLADKIMSFRRHWHKPDHQESWTPAEEGWSSHSPELYIKGCGQFQIDFFEEHHQRRLEEIRASSPCPGKVFFLTVCSWGKPYGHDYLHYGIRRRLAHCRVGRNSVLHRLEYYHISNAGIIPHEKMTSYPYYAYDWNNEWGSKQTDILLEEAITRRLNEWGRTQRQRTEGRNPIIVYAREGGHTLAAIDNSSLRDDHEVFVVAANPHDPSVEDVRLGLSHSVIDPNDVLLTEGNLSAMAGVVIDVLKLQEG